MRCVIVESEHKSESKGKETSFDTDTLLVAGLVFLLLSQKKGSGAEARQRARLLNLDGMKDLLGKMADNDLLILMLIYLLL